MCKSFRVRNEINIGTEICLFQMTIHPILTWDYSTEPLDVGNVRRLEVFDRRYLRQNVKHYKKALTWDWNVDILSVTMFTMFWRNLETIYHLLNAKMVLPPKRTTENTNQRCHFGCGSIGPVLFSGSRTGCLQFSYLSSNGFLWGHASSNIHKAGSSFCRTLTKALMRTL